MPASVDLLAEPSVRTSPLQLPQPPHPLPPPLPRQSPRAPQGEGIPNGGLHSSDPAAPATCTDTGTSSLSRCSGVARICSGSLTCPPRSGSLSSGVNGQPASPLLPRGEDLSPARWVMVSGAGQGRERLWAGRGGEAEGDGGGTENSSSLRLPSLGLLSKPRPALKNTSGLHP